MLTLAHNFAKYCFVLPALSQYQICQCIPTDIKVKNSFVWKQAIEMQ